MEDDSIVTTPQKVQPSSEETEQQEQEEAKADEQQEEKDLGEELFEQLSTLEQAKYVERRLDAVNETLSATATATSQSTPAKYSTPGRSQGRLTRHAPSSSASKRIGNATMGTPVARPINWIVKQANTEVKALRERAEKLNWHIQPSALADVLGDHTPTKDLNDKENETPRKAQLQRNEKALKETLHDYRRQLEEACSVICEQDRLIHAGR